MRFPVKTLLKQLSLKIDMMVLKYFSSTKALKGWTTPKYIPLIGQSDLLTQDDLSI